MSGKIGALRLFKQKNSTNTGSVFFLHGAADTGQNILNWVQEFLGDAAFPHIKLIFPTAPLRPFRPFDGEIHNVWFDRIEMTPDVPDHLETLESIGGEMKSLIKQEVDAGIPLNRIVMGGFSMGGALSLHTAYRFNPGLAGVFALSSFINNDSILYKHLQSNSGDAKTPLYMCHGDADDIVPIRWGRNTFRNLTELGVQGEFVVIKNLTHELEKGEIEGLWKWFSKIIPDN